MKLARYLRDIIDMSCFLHESNILILFILTKNFLYLWVALIINVINDVLVPIVLMHVHKRVLVVCCWEDARRPQVLPSRPAVVHRDEASVAPDKLVRDVSLVQFGVYDIIEVSLVGAVPPALRPLVMRDQEPHHLSKRFPTPNQRTAANNWTVENFLADVYVAATDPAKVICAIPNRAFLGLKI